MINKLATVYVEVFRNIPPLLQILFWYFAVFLTMPLPRNGHTIADTFYMSSRRLNMPAAIGTEAFWPFVISVVLAIAAVVLMVRWANKRFEDTGVPFHKFWAAVPSNRMCISMAKICYFFSFITYPYINF